MQGLASDLLISAAVVTTVYPAVANELAVAGFICSLYASVCMCSTPPALVLNILNEQMNSFLLFKHFNITSSEAIRHEINHKNVSILPLLFQPQYTLIHLKPPPDPASI